MKKQIVYESLQDFREASMTLDEAFLQNAVGAIKKFFQKVGKFFVHAINGKVTSGVVAPVNIGVMEKEKMLKNSISFIISKI